MTIETQKHRTELSWRRTVLSAFGVAVLLTRFVLVSAPPVFAAVGALVWMALFILARRRVKGVDRPIGRVLPAVVLLILIYVVTSVGLVLHIV